MISNKVGLTSIVVTYTTTGAQAADIVPQFLDVAIVSSITGADVALVVSSIGGVLFIIEKLFSIALAMRRRNIMKLREQQIVTLRAERDRRNATHAHNARARLKSHNKDRKK